MAEEQNCQNQKSIRLSWSRIMITILFVAITVAVTSGIIWWRFMAVITIQQNHISSLENQIDSLSERLIDINNLCQ